MFARISIRIILTIILGTAGVVPAMAENAAPTYPQSVPGARVTIEGGVRVIRPAPLLGHDSGGGPEQQYSGAMIYRGAAFYRVPDSRPPRISGRNTDEGSD